MEKPDLRAALLVLENSDFVEDFLSEVKEGQLENYYAKKIYGWVKDRFMENKRIGLTKAISDLNLPSNIFENNVILKSEFEIYIEEIKTNYIKSQIESAASELYELVNEEWDTDDYLSKAQEIILEKTEMDETKDFTEINDALIESYTELSKREEGEETKAIKTGFPTLDRKIIGLEEGHLTVIAGQTSMGKTALALNIIFNVIRQNYNVVKFSLEMKSREVTDRLLVMDSRVNINKYQKGLDSAEWKNIDASLNRLCDKNLAICDRRGLSVTDIRALAMRRDKRVPIDLIVVDYLQMIRHTTKESNKASAVGDTCIQLRTLAGDLDVPIILISQLNRQVDGKPTMHHMRDSGMIEEIADEIFLLWRSEYGEEGKRQEIKKRQEAELIMAKGRTKGVGFVPLIWYPELQTFRDAWIDEQEGWLI